MPRRLGLAAGESDGVQKRLMTTAVPEDALVLAGGGLLVALAQHVGPLPCGLRAAGGDDGDLLGGGVDVDDADLRLHLLGHEDGADDALLGLLDVPCVSGAAQVLEAPVGRLARLGGLVVAHGPDVLDDANSGLVIYGAVALMSPKAEVEL